MIQYTPPPGAHTHTHYTIDNVYRRYVLSMIAQF